MNRGLAVGVEGWTGLEEENGPGQRSLVEKNQSDLIFDCSTCNPTCERNLQM